MSRWGRYNLLSYQIIKVTKLVVWLPALATWSGTWEYQTTKNISSVSFYQFKRVRFLYQSRHGKLCHSAKITLDIPKSRFLYQSRSGSPYNSSHVGICANSGHLPWSSVSNLRTVKSQVCDGRLVCWPLPICRKKRTWSKNIEKYDQYLFLVGSKHTLMTIDDCLMIYHLVI